MSFLLKSEKQPLKADDEQSAEAEIGQNGNALLTAQTIGGKFKQYGSKWFKKLNKSEEPAEEEEPRRFGLSQRQSMLLAVYKEEFKHKLKNYVNIERFLPFILIIITLFRFIYVNMLMFTYLHYLNTHSAHRYHAACSCTLFIVYIVFMARSIIDSLDTQILPFFTYLSVYYQYIPFKSHYVCFMQFWPLIGMILSYIVYGILFSVLLFFIPWMLCDAAPIKYEVPLIFWHWLTGFQYIVNIFSGQWSIKYLFSAQYWTSLDVIYNNYFIMSYLPYMFLIGVVFGVLLIRHIILNLKTIFVRFMFKTWRNFKQFYIILMPVILFRWIYLVLMWSFFFFASSNAAIYTNGNSASCDIVLFAVFIIMVLQSVFDALCTPLIGVEFCMYFNCMQDIFSPILRACLSRVCGKFIQFPNEDELKGDYNQVFSDKNEQTDIEEDKKCKKTSKNIKQVQKKIIKKLKVSFNSFTGCIGKNGVIILLSVGWCLLKLLLSYLIFGVVFVFLAVGIIWGNCADTNIQSTPQLMWQWFVAPKYLLHLNQHWHVANLFNVHDWNSVETIFLNYFMICFVPYLVVAGLTILWKIFYKLYSYLAILTEGFSKICGTEWTLLFIVFIFYRWLYLVYMWYTLLFSEDAAYFNDSLPSNGELLSCRVALVTVFAVIAFRSIFDSFLCIEFFVYTFDRDLWPLFIIGLLWNGIKLIVSYLMLMILSAFFLLVFGFVNCSGSYQYIWLFWEWFIAPKYLPHLVTKYGESWRVQYLFHKQYWTSMEIIYLNYTVTAYSPIIVALLLFFVYYLCHCRRLRHNIMFTLFRKRAQLIVTMLFSYNALISFVIYMLNAKMNTMFLVICCCYIGLVPFLIFFKCHGYFTRSWKYDKSLVSYWFLKAIDWHQTFILFAARIYDFGKEYIVWDESMKTFKQNNKNRKCDPNLYYYWFFRSIHTLIKLLFLAVSMLLYAIEVAIKLVFLSFYVLLRFLHYVVVMYLMYYCKLAQIKVFRQHYVSYCVGIRQSEEIEEKTTDETSDNDSSDSSLETKGEEINDYWLFNLSLFVEVTCQSFSMLLIVIVNNLVNPRINSFVNAVTVWTLIATLLVVLNAVWNMVPQCRNKGGLKHTLKNQVFGASKAHNIQYGLITTDVDDASVVLGDVVQY